MRWVFQALFAVSLIGAPGCVTNATIDMLIEFAQDEVYEEVEVSELAVRWVDSSFEVAVLYGDGVLRRTVWEPGAGLQTGKRISGKGPRHRSVSSFGIHAAGADLHARERLRCGDLPYGAGD